MASQDTQRTPRTSSRRANGTAEPRRGRVPKLRHHKGSGQGFVELNGRYVYLGVWGLPETEER